MMPNLPPMNSSLLDAQKWLRERLDEGAPCPCCTQFAKVYRRKVNAGMARALITLYHASRLDTREHYHLTSLARWTHEGGQLSWWGLIAQDDGVREDGGKSGWWRITSTGELFVRNRLLVPKYARIYDGRLMSFDDTEQASIIDALGKKFDYRELMAGG